MTAEPVTNLAQNSDLDSAHHAITPGDIQVENTTATGSDSDHEDSPDDIVTVTTIAETAEDPDSAPGSDEPLRTRMLESHAQLWNHLIISPFTLYLQCDTEW